MAEPPICRILSFKSTAVNLIAFAIDYALDWLGKLPVEAAMSGC